MTYEYRHTDEKWLHPVQLAMKVGCSERMVRYHLRHKNPYIQKYAHNVPGLGWMIHSDGLANPYLWTTLTGTANRKQWAPAWTGDRSGTKARRKRLQSTKRTKATNPVDNA